MPSDHAHELRDDRAPPPRPLTADSAGFAEILDRYRIAAALAGQHRWRLVVAAVVLLLCTGYNRTHVAAMPQSPDRWWIALAIALAALIGCGAVLTVLTLRLRRARVAAAALPVGTPTVGAAPAAGASPAAGAAPAASAGSPGPVAGTTAAATLRARALCITDAFQRLANTLLSLAVASDALLIVGALLGFDIVSREGALLALCTAPTALLLLHAALAWPTRDRLLARYRRDYPDPPPALA